MSSTCSLFSRVATSDKSTSGMGDFFDQKAVDVLLSISLVSPWLYELYPV